MDIISTLVTAGVSILLIALLAMITGQVLTSLPPQDGIWNETMTTIGDTAGTAFNLISIAPLVLGAAVIISTIVGAVMVVRR